MTDKQPKALWLADELETHEYDFEWHSTAAAELRRLHEVNAELVEALMQVWGATTDYMARKNTMPVSLVNAAAKADSAIAKATGEQQ
jgi:hypothetical protein